MTVVLAAPLDSLRRIATPEGCEIELRVAGPFTRARAWTSLYAAYRELFFAEHR
ncbi:MAG: hypothetical protein HWD57_06590 [Candidatus Accumulibacter cognatus]|uniref:Uncharacterized protein n=1 Tax=Candidatus Accumulibacter cognatus TaxID=2954383 RepID=A0A7D5SD34_9PROT|nr:MAG: hypothetical protein HWD57_06590 [Candidatus Accumulibacter cognatus]